MGPVEEHVDNFGAMIGTYSSKIWFLACCLAPDVEKWLKEGANSRGWDERIGRHNGCMCMLAMAPTRLSDMVMRGANKNGAGDSS